MGADFPDQSARRDGESQTQDALRESEERFRCLIEQSIAGVYIVQGELFVYVNPKFAEIFGYQQEEISGRLPFVQTVSPADRPRVRENVARRLRGEMRAVRYEFRGVRKDGSEIDVEVQGTMVQMGGKATVVGICNDITDRNRALAALRRSEQRYALAAQAANDALWDWDTASGEVEFSARFFSMLGMEPQPTATLETWMGLVHPDDRPKLEGDLRIHLEGRQPHLEMEHRVRHADGHYLWLLVRGLAVRDDDGRPVRMAGSLTDISERKRTEEKLLHDALHDALTTLPNRTLLIDRVGQAIAFLQRREDYRFAVLCLDLDRFKTINDSLGHAAGDQLLSAVAHRIMACLRPGDTLARLGGDEFCVLVEDFADPDYPNQVAERILAALSTPHSLDGVDLVSTASIGIALGDRGYARAEEVLRDADLALYRAKDAGRARHATFQPGMHARARQLLQLEADLRRAIERAELSVYYQPVISLATGAIVGCEALCRWTHPTHGPIPPTDFIPLAEESSLIFKLGEFVLREACRKARGWNEQRVASPLSVSVNLSPKQLAQRDLLDQIRSALRDSKLSPRQLKLEVTESALIENVGPASVLLGQLRDLNVGLLLDDFGTGYSSLSHLHNFRFDTLKIDRSFVSRVELGGKHREIVRTIASLGRTLEMDVVAEGIETRGQLGILRELGADTAQGYYFSRPVEAPVFERLLAGRPPWNLPATLAVAGR